MRPRLLDLYCGAGGAAMGYHRAGFDVVGVDINPQPHYPFEFHQADALTFPLDGYDVIHASPPCQRYSIASQRWNGRPAWYPSLIEATRARLIDAGCIYVIENVPRAPLTNPITLCGSAFGLGVRRHRLFESNVELWAPDCDHGSQKPRYRVYDHGHWYLSSVVAVYGEGGGKGKEYWHEAMGIDWHMPLRDVAQAIPPAYTRFIGAQVLEQLVAPGPPSFTI